MAQPVKKKKKDPYRKRNFPVRIFFRENFTLFSGIFAEGLKNDAICVMIIGEAERRKSGNRRIGLNVCAARAGESAREGGRKR